MITEFKIYENLSKNLGRSINLSKLKVGDFWKPELNYDSDKWWIITELDFTGNFWLNTNNNIKCIHIHLTNINNVKDEDLFDNYFNYTTKLTPNDIVFSNVTGDLEEIWNNNRDTIMKITKALLKSKNSQVADVWIKNLPELELEIETNKYNL